MKPVPSSNSDKSKTRLKNYFSVVLPVSFLFADHSLDLSDSSDRDHFKTQVKRESESTFQRKVTVSQTQL